jgi:nitroreductase
MQAIRARHSVRRYTNREIEPKKLAALRAEIRLCNEKSGLHMRLVTDSGDSFSGLMVRAVFRGAMVFVVMAGAPAPDLEERVGYWGERVVLKAQMLGLNTCWAMMFNRKKYAEKIPEGERIVTVVSVGYGETQGMPHKSKPMKSLCRVEGGGDMPDWFREGMDAAMMAPTAMNRQPFMFTLTKEGTVRAEATAGGLAALDLGIAKYHFEVGTGRQITDKDAEV